MFTRTSRADQAKAQVLDATSTAGHQLREKVAPAVADAAREAKDWAAPRAKDAKDWAAPRARDAKDWAAPHVERGIEAAAPKVEAAVDRVSPAVDAARDKIVDDLLPRLVDAVNAAAAAGATATAGATVAAGTAKKRGKGAVAVAKGDAVAKPRHRGRRWLLVLTGLAAAAGAAVAVFKRQSPQDDPWAVPPTSYPKPASVPSGGSAASGGAAGSASAAAPLATGDATDALDSGGSLADADVPGLTVDSAAAKDAVEQADAAGDPLTDPIEKVHQASLRADDEKDAGKGGSKKS